MTLIEAEKEIRRLRRILREVKPEAVLKPNRAAHKEIQRAVLSFAQSQKTFTVDDLLGGPLPKQKRGALSANLLHIFHRGLIRRLRKGQKGRRRCPAVYAARDRR
jgi:hypothetical protein